MRRRRCPSYHLRCTAESSCRLGGNHRAHRRQCCHNRGSDCRRRACCSTHHSSVDIQRAGQQGGEVGESWFCASPRHARGSNQLGMTPCGRRFQQRGPIRATGRELCSCASTAVACHCQGSTFVSSRGRRRALRCAYWARLLSARSVRTKVSPWTNMVDLILMPHGLRYQTLS